jgi:RHS repeat-associated protein
VTAGSVTLSKQLFVYNLSGSMSSVTNEGYSGGTLSSVERRRYEYDRKSYRVSSLTETDVVTSSVAQNTWTVTSTVSFLADHHNHTGYAQTIRETKVENGNTLIQDYTFGNDEILQRIHGVQADGTAVIKTLIFGHDGHGSVRIVYNPTGKIEQTYTFTAYGNRLSVHGYQGNPLGLDAALTQLGYSGEYHDQKSTMQYLRARWMRDGFFITRDPFAGNMQDPQSLHKYAYVHGDPIQGVDPSGLNFFLANLGTTIHRQISEKYWASHFGNEVTFGTSVPGLAGAILPDIMDYTLGEIGEIKPLSRWGLASGPVQVAAAVQVSNGISVNYKGHSYVLSQPVEHYGSPAPWKPSTWQPGIQVVWPGLIDQFLYGNFAAVTVANFGGVIYYHRIRMPNNSGLATQFAMEQHAIRIAEGLSAEMKEIVKNGFDSTAEIIWQYKFEAAFFLGAAIGLHILGSNVVGAVETARVGRSLRPSFNYGSIGGGLAF